MLYVLSSWAAVAGYADWKGTVTGVNFLGSFNEAAPFLDLSRHFSHWFDWFIGLVGFTSSFGCFIAAANSRTRITFNGARAGLLPPRMATVSRTKVPFRPLKHVVIPLIGSAVLVYGIYEFVQPSQPPPANVFWAWILGIVVVSAIATAIVYVRRPDALNRAATAGPELVVADAR